MSLTIELSPDLERQLEDAAARAGQDPSELATAAVVEKLLALSADPERRRMRQLALLERWNAEDATHPDRTAAPLIPRLSFREPDRG